jgi:apolipoprotein N-acyltransferase
MKKVLAVSLVALLATGCASVSLEEDEPKKKAAKEVILVEPNMPLKLDSEVRRMSREEIIVAIQECKEADLRPLALKVPAKINNFETKVIVDVICGPKFK